MATYARYFSTDEIRLIVDNWKTVRTEWAPLLAQARQMKARGVPATDARVQPLAHHWMGLIHRWLGGDFDLIERWGRMHQQEPASGRDDAPDAALLCYVEEAIALRMAAWRRHFSMAELSRFRPVDAAQWQQLEAVAAALIAAGVPPTSVSARALAGRLHALVGQSVGNDPEQLQKLRAAMAAEPLLRAGTLLPVPVLAYLQRAAEPQSP